MQQNRTVQTAFRFPPEMVSELKMLAGKKRMSLNSYVVVVLQEALAKERHQEEDRYEALFRELSKIRLPKTVSEEVMALSSYQVHYTEEELAQDDRLRYLLSK